MSETIHADQIGERDHSITSEYRIFGPPGTGKTTNLSKQVRRAVERFGPNAVLITSFSRAAAAELAGRDLPVDRDRIGTLHSHCYHALGAPAIAEANVEEWNKENPHLRITPVKQQGKLDGEDAAEGVDDDNRGPEKDGDTHLAELNRWRAQMIPARVWPKVVQQFSERWQEYKNSLGLMDFTDLIETCYHDVHFAPKTPSVIFADEAQDLNKLQLSLIRKWGSHTEYFIVAGDDDQTIYSFTGAAPDAILDPDIPNDHKIILKQSFRVPRAVHAMANRWIHQVTRRQEKEYLPRDVDGACAEIGGTWETPEYGILRTAVEHLERGQTVMFLAACSYMLQPIVRMLRKEAIPFHNPYRRSNGFWNPIRILKRGAAANRILALLVAHPGFGEDHREWNAGEFALWTEWLMAKGILKHGAKTRIQNAQTADPTRPITIADLDETFEPGALESLLGCFDGDYRALLVWWRDRVNDKMKNRIQFPADIAAVRGPDALIKRPQVIVGTIHSVKGGEADVVFLFPDLSQAGDRDCQVFGPPRDSVIRLFYVGMTRAREALYLASSVGNTAVRFIL